MGLTVKVSMVYKLPRSLIIIVLDHANCDGTVTSMLNVAI